MNLKARILRLERQQKSKTGGKITIDVFDRIVNDTISDEEFSRWMPFWQEILADREATCEPH